MDVVRTLALGILLSGCGAGDGADTDAGPSVHDAGPSRQDGAVPPGADTDAGPSVHDAGPSRQDGAIPPGVDGGVAAPEDAGGDGDGGAADGGVRDAGADAALPPGDLVPGNVEDRVSLDAGTAAVVVASGDTLAFRPYDGGVMRIPAVGSVTMVREPGVEGYDPASGIYFTELPPVTSGGAPLAVFAFDSLHVEPGGRLVGARGEAALVLLVATTALIEGTLDVSALGALAGPGAGDGGAPRDDLTAAMDGAGEGAGAAPERLEGDTRYAGGGGGAFGSAGGAGGDTIDAAGASAGAAYGTERLVPLVGGSGGGAGDGPDTGYGGGGGGAVQLSAGESIVLTGTIHAGGGGGAGGEFIPFMVRVGGAGGGGGSGGAILLESPEVRLEPDARVLASGGGGGAGTPNCGPTRCASEGRDAPETGETAGPGTVTADSGDGGAGSDELGSDGQSAPMAPGDDAGGGGGGAGRIRIQVAGAGSYVPGGTLIPPVSSGLATVGEVEVAR